jgi:hypothetical protein
MQTYIRNRRYKLRFTDELPRSVDGECDPPNVPNKEIRIKSKLRDERLLAVLLHEMLHGGLWDIEEVAVDNLSSDMARILWRLGYRRVGTDG